ncbi:MAG: hypothetical protein CVV16_05530 [Gammaproteobacteria bacterium HGW-Gammaproteobacteria-6]|nr:MAG: hypothetical protein CVV16_05530 [Gammaproteobacteria bacterium HGW-Gammaproteobacteria-6]
MTSQSTTLLAPLDTLLARRNQRFVCVDSGWPEPGPQRHIAQISHQTEPGLDQETLDYIGQQLGDVAELLAFYQRFGELRLYCDNNESEHLGQASAFLIAHPSMWPTLRAEFDDWVDSLEDDEAEELLPGWLDDFMVFGEVPNSGNYFLLALGPEQQGQVFEFEHDGFEFIARGNFSTFINRLAEVNDDLLREISGHTRYSDGHSDTQWLCREYLYDAN